MRADKPPAGAFRDRSGRMTGTAERQRDGTQSVTRFFRLRVDIFRDGQGKLTRSATARPRKEDVARPGPLP